MALSLGSPVRVYAATMSTFTRMSELLYFQL